MEKHKQTNEDINITINNSDHVLTWIERLLKLLKEYGPFKIIGATFLLIFMSAIVYFCFNITEAIKTYKLIQEEIHSNLMEKRYEMGPKIQSLTDKLTFGIDASRTMILELHNGNENTNGLPFTKCTATYESLNVSITPVSEQYQNINMSLLPFTMQLFHDGYWRGDTEDLLEIDRGLYYKLKSNGTEHFAACLIEGIDNKPIAFMIISFNKCSSELNNHDCNITRENIRHVAMELAVLLEVGRLMK